MADATQTLLTVGIPTLAVLIGILVNNSRLSDVDNRIGELRHDMNRRFDDVNRRIEGTRDLLRAEFLRVALEENR